MNTISTMLEALKATQPTRQHHQTLEDFGVIFQKHHAAIAAGEAELRREPDAWMSWSKSGGVPIAATPWKGDIALWKREAGIVVVQLYTRGETK